ncbi:MAG: hypothetical protein P1V18_01160 [Candidatus Gracilibacteria bacterium]|nr:hypothetical protein [Candidatus Gracilibacteria bacterium]
MAQKTKTKKDDNTPVVDINALAGAIESSALPEGKKIAYIYMLAEGTLTLAELEKINVEMEEAGKDLEAVIAKEQAELDAIELELAELEDQKFDMELEHAIQFEKNAEKLVNAAYGEAEKIQGEEEHAEIQDIQKKLSDN